MEIKDRKYPVIWLLIVILLLGAHISYELMAAGFKGSNDPRFLIMSYTPYAILIELGISVYLIKRKTFAGYIILLVIICNILLNVIVAAPF